MQHFDSSVSDVRQHLLIMASHAETSLTSALKSLWERDDEKAKFVISNDSMLDQLHKEVDCIAFKHLALRHPFAGNLRYIATAIRIASNLERIGDESVTIARKTMALNAEPPFDVTWQSKELAGLASSLVSKALNSYVFTNHIQAEEVINSDVEIDSLNHEIHSLMVNRMIEDSTAITRCLHLIVISKCLERIGDHATNIAEDTYFLHSGTHLRRREINLLKTNSIQKWGYSRYECKNSHR